MVFTVCCEPYLQSEYGADYVSDSPVKLLDRLLHGQRQIPDEQVRPFPIRRRLAVGLLRRKEPIAETSSSWKWEHRNIFCGGMRRIGAVGVHARLRPALIARTADAVMRHASIVFATLGSLR